MYHLLSQHTGLLTFFLCIPLSLAELFKTFEADTVLIWMAMVMKRRVFVYADRVPDLLRIVR